GGGSWAGDRGRGRCRPGPRPWDHGGPPGSRQSPRITAVRTFPAVTGLPAPSRTIVMGVVNVTPDSFSDGGEWLDPEAAIRQLGRGIVGGGSRAGPLPPRSAPLGSRRSPGITAVP